MKSVMLALVTAAAAASIALAAPANAAPPQNLRVDDALRAELLQSAAQFKGIPASEFVGLRKGMTYYAYDPDTTTYWAGASLIPTNWSERAQVSVQDGGSYMLFRMVKGGLWTAFNDGMSREHGGCPQDVPAAVLSMWQWDPLDCRPPFS